MAHPLDAAAAYDLGGRTDALPAREADRAPDADQALVARVLAGEPDAYRPLVDRDGPGVIRAARRVLGDADDAEDVAQEAFVIAYRSLAEWRGDGPFGAWVTRIAVRLAVRRASRRRTVSWIAADDGAAPLHVNPRGGEDPAAAALRGDRTVRLRAAVAALDEPYREVVTLRFFGELSLEEIAAATNRPLNTVKTHLRRGLARIRTAVDGEDLR
jgi:RNA polymerase sigma-70 factor, ECF subfamily